jgi:Plasmid pRiA4b ORF-3-like protein.
VKHEVCQIRVELTGVHPLIWRQLLVPSNVTLMKLHRVLQCAMGWEDSHSYTFESGSNVPLNRSLPNACPSEDCGGAPGYEDVFTGDSETKQQTPHRTSGVDRAVVRPARLLRR